MVNLGAILAKYTAHGPEQVPPDEWENFLGVRAKVAYHPMAAQLGGTSIEVLPFNNDGVFGNAYEYYAFLRAIDASSGEKDRRFTAVEVGAGVGSWLPQIGVVCVREGFSDVHLIAVEADAQKSACIKEHLEINGLLGNRVTYELINGAAWETDTTLWWPKIGFGDYGGAATESNDATDYRGLCVEHSSIPAYSLASIIGARRLVNYVHMDIQGAERQVCRSATHVLNRSVKHLFIATHSRSIEGELLEFFFGLRWDLRHFSPCAFRYDMSIPSLAGMTISDGEMYWENPHIDHG